MILRNYLKKESREYSDADIHKFGTYVIEELPEIICRVPIAGITYDAFVYPFDGEITRLVEKIQQGKIFPEIKKNVMDTEPKVFLEVR